MKNKRGQVFEVVLIFIVLFLCAMVILITFRQNDKAEGSTVSPGKVLELKYQLEFYEILEREFILESLGEVNSSFGFGSGEFKKEFRRIFLEKFSENDDMKEFIFEDLTVNGVMAEKDAKLNSDVFFETTLYPSVSDDGFVFRRGAVGKSFTLNSLQEGKIDFPVEVDFNLEKKYEIGFADGKYYFIGEENL
ncbi:MAG: hypothetical protein ABIF88_01710 [archaeon]